MRPDSPRVLVADDDEQIRELLRIRLELDGLETIMARDGVEAIGAITSHRPSAMLLDVNMPRMDGFQVLEALRRTGRRPPPTLMLTARNAPDDVRKAIGLGAKDYLAKPFSDQLLLRRVRRLLKAAPPQPAPPQPRSPPTAEAASSKDLFL